ncbi:MAG: hypothetical protein M1816_004883 [Peltula sp. TS41687]|nr:MAG: hypothetical protein M1816_004883 [Peltula sp. TS41687]
MTMNNNSPEKDVTQDTLSDNEDTSTAENLLTRGRALLHEIEQFQACLQEQGKENTVDLKAFKNSLQTELKSLRKRDATIHNLRSSNLPFYTAVWDTAKSCCGVVAISKRFTIKIDDDPNTSQPTEKFTVDIIANGGAEWVKVSTITEMRLIFEMTKNGWEFGQSDTESKTDEEHDEDDDDTAIHLQKVVRDLQKAAAGIIFRYTHPKIRIVLPKVELGVTKEIDHLMNTIIAQGCVVQCAKERIAPLALDEAIPRMVYDEFALFTPTVNIDCTLLLALVSDLSHGPVTIQPSHHVAIRRQIEREETDRLLPTSLWPAMADREPVCTSHAARRMREIVDLIGTPEEKARTALLMGDDAGGRPRERLLDEFQEYSAHAVPREWRIPIKVVQEDEILDPLGALPSVAKVVSEQLSDINRSVFLYGWARGITTLSSNRTVVKMIEKVVEESGGDVGPDT